MTTYGHEADPVEDLCLEFRASRGGHWSDHPCRCAEIRVAQDALRERIAAEIAALPPETNGSIGAPHWVGRAEALAVVRGAGAA